MSPLLSLGPSQASESCTLGPGTRKLRRGCFPSGLCRQSLNCPVNFSVNSVRNPFSGAEPGPVKGPWLLYAVKAGVGRLEAEALATANLPEKFDLVGEGEYRG